MVAFPCRAFNAIIIMSAATAFEVEKKHHPTTYTIKSNDVYGSFLSRMHPHTIQQSMHAYINRVPFCTHEEEVDRFFVYIQHYVMEGDSSYSPKKVWGLFVRTMVVSLGQYKL